MVVVLLEVVRDGLLCNCVWCVCIYFVWVVDHRYNENDVEYDADEDDEEFLVQLRTIHPDFSFDALEALIDRFEKQRYECDMFRTVWVVENYFFFLNHLKKSIVKNREQKWEKSEEIIDKTKEKTVGKKVQLKRKMIYKSCKEKNRDHNIIRI